MNDIIEIIKSRRTIKSFEAKFLSWEQVAKILDAGRHAPSSGNLQNWKFIAVLEPDLKTKLAEATHDQFNIAMASVLIIVCAEPEKAERYFGARGERLYTIQNCAAAIQNMLLEAHSLGLGGCWVGAFNEDKIKEICGIPAIVRPQAIVAIGYAKEVPNKPAKFPLETVVYFNKWKNKLRDPEKYSQNYSAILARKAGAAKEKLDQFKKDIVGKF
ncbi:nitroreductase family protein [Candidatus Woesearchaeota archaeon]|nr:nitroreductase family protein [Candidatus Woesearchaeota archaeon]